MKNILLSLLTPFISIPLFASAKEPVVTAEKLLKHKKASQHFDDFQSPETVLVCYQRGALEHLLGRHPEFQPVKAVSHFYTDGRVGILGDWGVGAPGLAIKMEELIVLGAKRFIAVGTAGGLLNRHEIGDFIVCREALAEDGVAHLYLPEGHHFVEADKNLISEWVYFTKERTLPSFQETAAWSFSAIFKETVEDAIRVTGHGCSVVEMESATLYAIGKEKHVEALSLFVISDSITEKGWTPSIKDPKMRASLHKLAEWALDFCLSKEKTTMTNHPQNTHPLHNDELKLHLEKMVYTYQMRDWQKFHSPKNLTMSLAGEVGELVDLFRWLTEEESYKLDAKTLEAARDEIGDVFNNLIYLAHKLGIDPFAAAKQKLLKLEQKYPLEASRGKPLKYTHYQENQ